MKSEFGQEKRENKKEAENSVNQIKEKMTKIKSYKKSYTEIY